MNAIRGALSSSQHPSVLWNRASCDEARRTDVRIAARHLAGVAFQCQPIKLSRFLAVRKSCRVVASSGGETGLPGEVSDSELPVNSLQAGSNTDAASLDTLITEQLARVAGNETESAEDRWLNDLVAFSEEREGGKKYLEVAVTSIHQIDHGMVAGLLCTSSNRGLPLERCREFPLFLNALVAGPIQEAVQRGGLPHAFEALPNLNQLDLQTALVHEFATPPEQTATFVLLDEISGNRMEIGSTYHQAMAVALRYRLPIRIEAGAIADCNRDFLQRMLLNPSAREQTDDASLISNLSERLYDLIHKPQNLRRQLQVAVHDEAYDEAAQLKSDLQQLEQSWGRSFFSIMHEIRDFYLNRMSVFFRL